MMRRGRIGVNGVRAPRPTSHRVPGTSHRWRPPATDQPAGLPVDTNRECIRCTRCLRSLIIGPPLSSQVVRSCSRGVCVEFLLLVAGCRLCFCGFDGRVQGTAGRPGRAVSLGRSERDSSWVVIGSGGEAFSQRSTVLSMWSWAMPAARTPVHVEAF